MKTKKPREAWAVWNKKYGAMCFHETAEIAEKCIVRERGDVVVHMREVLPKRRKTGGGK